MFRFLFWASAFERSILAFMCMYIFVFNILRIWWQRQWNMEEQTREGIERVKKIVRSRPKGRESERDSFIKIARELETDRQTDRPRRKLKVRQAVGGFGLAMPPDRSFFVEAVLYNSTCVPHLSALVLFNNFLLLLHMCVIKVNINDHAKM